MRNTRLNIVFQESASLEPATLHPGIIYEKNLSPHFTKMSLSQLLVSLVETPPLKILFWKPRFHLWSIWLNLSEVGPRQEDFFLTPPQVTDVYPCERHKHLDCLFLFFPYTTAFQWKVVTHQFIPHQENQFVVTTQILARIRITYQACSNMDHWASFPESDSGGPNQ